MKQGWVYVLTNQGMPGLIKIGFTKNLPQERARELYGTGVAYPFEVAYQVCCYHYPQVERKVHAQLSDKRVNGGREFFACPVEEAAQVIRQCAGKNLISAQDLRTGEVWQNKPADKPSKKTSVQTASHHWRIRHYHLIGGGLALVIIWLAWLGFRSAGEMVELSEAQQVTGYVSGKIGKEDINIRACPSTECGVISVLPANQNIQIKPLTRTAKNWVYAEFQGDVCYPEHYERGQGCRLWAQNNIVEGWVYADNLAGQNIKPAKRSDSLFDSLF
ncbi:GIY-YIG nuclease family protein [Neisseria yangbaofengii]|uniref:GIY-YIG nuclease family protein n=1 Tax=Neisseria yangbaofengii TaxID=2709396 RepID=UPI0013EC4F25|nr:GIY-YIG nuclease family protein [Neisseria yangbaofengii]